MIVFLSELRTGSTYNGIIRSQADLNILIRNFVTLIKTKYNIREQDMRITVS